MEAERKITFARHLYKHLSDVIVIVFYINYWFVSVLSDFPRTQILQTESLGANSNSSSGMTKFPTDFQAFQVFILFVCEFI